MATYAVGDIQGCYDPLRRLLDRIDFQPGADSLWVTGDLVNRGPDSLTTLRFLKSLGRDCIAVLGNHDLHLLGIGAGVRKMKKKDTLAQILSAPDAGELLDWLRYRPFLHHDGHLGFTMVHAGIPPIWTLQQAMTQARQLEEQLRSDDYRVFLEFLFKFDKEDQINSLSKAINQKAKMKVCVNYFTRMRCCGPRGKLDFKNKSAKCSSKKKYAPWFSFPHSPVYHERIIFGHWAALEGHTGRANIYALDTGCVWGKSLTALDLESGVRTSVSA